MVKDWQCRARSGVRNASLKDCLKANRMDHKAWEVNGLRLYPRTLWMKPLRKVPQRWARPRGEVAR